MKELCGCQVCKVTIASMLRQAMPGPQGGEEVKPAPVSNEFGFVAAVAHARARRSPEADPERNGIVLQQQGLEIQELPARRSFGLIAAAEASAQGKRGGSYVKYFAEGAQPRVQP